MTPQTRWATKLPAVNHDASFEIEDATPAKIALVSDELCGGRLPRIVGNSAALRRVLDLVRMVAPTRATVLINGETGTGKELVAETLHEYSDRSNGPLVKVYCAAIPAGLIESDCYVNGLHCVPDHPNVREGRGQVCSTAEARLPAVF